MLDNVESLLKDLGNELLEFKNTYNDIANDVEATLNKASIRRSHAKIVEIFIAVKRNS